MALTGADRADERLDFDAMDEFISEVLGALREDGSRAVRVFPPAAGVLIFFADRIASEVVRRHTTGDQIFAR